MSANDIEEIIQNRQFTARSGRNQIGSPEGRTVPSNRHKLSAAIRPERAGLRGSLPHWRAGTGRVRRFPR